MGLDIYTYRHLDLKRKQEHEGRASDIDSELWKKICGDGYDRLPQKEKDERYEKYKKEKAKQYKKEKLQVNEDGNYEGEGDECIEFASKKHPEFQVGYARSSYNGGGFNHVMRNLGLPDLYDIYGHSEGYIFQPDWVASLERATDALGRLNDIIKNGESFKVFSIRTNFVSDEREPRAPRSEAEALALFMGEYGEHKGKPKDKFMGGSYSKLRGSFFMDEPLQVVALIPGYEEFGGKEPSVYAVFKSDMTWYRDMLEVVIETIEYVLAQPDKENIYLHWSA